MPDSGLPLLVIVTGRPGAGKTTLATALSNRLQFQLLSRDEIKEEIVRLLGTPLPEHAQLGATTAFFMALATFVESGVSLVAEAAFQHKLWAPRLEPLLSLADVRIVVCEVPPELAFERRVERELQDPERLTYHAHLPAGEEYIPPNLDVPTLTVDTSSEVEMETILTFLGR